MKYEEKIKRELDKYNRQWESTVCPDVIKYGKQADKEIAQWKVLCSKLSGDLADINNEQKKIKK